jgi:prepilin-type processing-associated H-X9-DG protein
MYNYFAGLNGNQVNAHARNCWLSVALHRYDRGTSNLKRLGFDPEDRWTDAKRTDYENRLMPEHYACPFERGKSSKYELYYTDTKFDYWEWRGRFESYHTWFHDFVMIRNTPVAGGPQWPVAGGAGVERKGIPQYSAFTFNRRDDPDLQGFFQAGGIDFASEWLQSYLHRRWVSWGPRDMRTYKTASLSGMAVVYCAQGEHIQWPQTGLNSRLGRANVGSHATGRGGGTNVIFADGHVDWVIGTRIGLP